MLNHPLALRLTFTSPITCHTQTKNYFNRRLYLKYFFQHLILLKLIYQYRGAASIHFYYNKNLRARFVTTKAPYRYKITRNHYLRELTTYMLFINFFKNVETLPDFYWRQMNTWVMQFTKLEFAYFNLKSVKIRLNISYRI